MATDDIHPSSFRCSNPAACDVAFKFMPFCFDLFSSYLDAVAGIDQLRENVIAFQEEKIVSLRSSNPTKATIAFMDSQPLTHEFIEDQRGPQKVLHGSTQGDFKQRTAMAGRDMHLLGQMAIVFLFGSWEHRYRTDFAEALGLSTPNELTSDLFGDLRVIRNAIVHNHGVANKQTAETKILHWFREGERMFFPRNRVDKLLENIDAYITEICGMTWPTEPTPLPPKTEWWKTFGIVRTEF